MPFRLLCGLRLFNLGHRSPGIFESYNAGIKLKEFELWKCLSEKIRVLKGRLKKIRAKSRFAFQSHNFPLFVYFYFLYRVIDSFYLACLVCSETLNSPGLPQHRLPSSFKMIRIGSSLSLAGSTTSADLTMTVLGCGKYDEQQPASV